MIASLAWRASIYGALAALCFGSGWLVNGWRLGSELSDQSASYSKSLSAITAAAADALSKQQAKQIELANTLAAIDAQHYQELTHAKAVSSSLSADLASQRKRLSVRVSNSSCSGLPTATSSASLDDGAKRADIHPETAARITEITGDADQCAVKLSALQDWVIQSAKP